MRNLHRGGIAAFTLACAVPAAASPYVTPSMDAATTPEIKLEGEYERSRSGWTLEGPAIDATLPLAKGLETSVTFGKGWQSEGGADRRAGWLDTEVAMKWEVLPYPEAGGFGLTTEPALIVPTGSHGMGDDQWRLEVPIIAGWKSGRSAFDLMAGYSKSLETREDELFAAALATRNLSDKVQIGGEISGSRAVHDQDDYALKANVGVKYELRHDLTLSGRVSRTLVTSDHVPVTGIALFVEKAF